MVISYIGKERCDILYFAVKVGLNTGKRILVLDNSISGDYFMLYQKDDGEDIVTINNLTVARNYKIGNKAQEFDCVYIYEGIRPKCEERVDLVIVAPTCEKSEWEMLREGIRTSEEVGNDNIMFILRDKVNRKFTERTVAAELGIVTEKFYEQPYDNKDYSVYVSLTHNNIARSGISGPLYDILANICNEVYGVNVKQFKKLMAMK